MKAEVYLSKLHQDLVDGIHSSEEFRKIGDSLAWTLCCDGLCCVLDFSRVQNPADLVSRPQNLMRWHIRQEKFGGLLWNPATNRVYQLDDEAYRVLMTLQEGTGMEKVANEYGVSQSDIYRLLGQISEQGALPGNKGSSPTDQKA